MHKSRFSYPISKPYPFRWFTPVTLVGGLVLAVLLSLLNLSANGFYLKTVYTSDPNSTEAHANAQYVNIPIPTDQTQAEISSKMVQAASIQLAK